MTADSGTDTMRVVAGRYQLRRELGRGGMGIVWQAWDPELEREVAIKEVLLPRDVPPQHRAELHARTRREARAAAGISHPSVITVHDVLDFEDHPWVVMELVHGRSLQEEILAKGPLTPRMAAAVARALLQAVRAAHATGVIHRDIKPGNAMLTPDDNLILTDFGIATVDGDANLTRTGVLIGSPSYMSPERMEHERATPAADLWSIGVTLYSVLQGEAPFERDNVSAAIAAVLSAPIPHPDKAGDLAPVILGLLERDPDRRLTADAALDLLRDGAGELAPMPQPTPPHVRTTSTLVPPELPDPRTARSWNPFGRGRWYFTLPIISAGLLASVPFWHAARRLRGDGRSEDAVRARTIAVRLTWGILVFPVAMIAALLLIAPHRTKVYSTDIVTLTVARSTRRRRADARRIAWMAPTVARRLRIGVPDQATGYDDGGLVDLNHAAPEELVDTFGIGPGKAQAIVAARERLGGTFTTLASLREIPGMSRRELAAIRDRAVLIRG